MEIKQIFNLGIQMGALSDLRGRDEVVGFLSRKKKVFNELSQKAQSAFDQEALRNPYLDSRILHIAKNKEIKKVLVGVDIDGAEILLADKLGDIDLIISHHPLGQGLSGLSDVMALQADVLSQYGVPINVAESLMKERMSEVARGVNSANHQRVVDTAKLMQQNLICIHTPCDNLAANFLRQTIENNKEVRTINDLMDILNDIPEYKEATKIGAGPKIFIGDKEASCGKIAITEITGGTSPSPKIYQKMAMAGIGTIVGMHMKEEHRKEAETAGINVVIAGHISSDSLGLNLFLDELEKRGIEIVPCSGVIRVSRIKE